MVFDGHELRFILLVSLMLAFNLLL
jgi:hypothetical protein